MPFLPLERVGSSRELADENSEFRGIRQRHRRGVLVAVNGSHPLGGTGPGGPEESREGTGITQLVVRSRGPSEVAAADTRGGGAVLSHQEAKRREAAAGGQGGGETRPPASSALPARTLPLPFLLPSSSLHPSHWTKRYPGAGFSFFS